MVQLHCNKWSETAESLIYFNRFPVRLETPIYSEALVKKSACVNINKKGADLFIKGMFKPEQSLWFTFWKYSYDKSET